jgi:hypothetical protein
LFLLSVSGGKIGETIFRYFSSMNRSTSLLLSTLVLFVFVSPVFAGTTSVPPTREQKAAIACVAENVKTREGVLANEMDRYTKTILDAYKERQSSLSESYGHTEISTKVLKTEVNVIWSTFRLKTRNAAKEWKNIKQDAWKTYKTNVKTCVDKSNMSDVSNAASEISGS